MSARVLMAIRPPFAEAVYRGEKLFEFRRVKARISPGVRIIVYESRPRSCVSGEFRAGRVITGHPHDLALLEPDPEMRVLVGRYLRGSRVATAIEILRPTRWGRCLSLAEFSRGRRPPQSYSFLRG